MTPAMGAPSFSQVAFEVAEGGFATTEPMIYPEFFKYAVGGDSH